MAEAPRRERESNAKNIAVGVGTTVGVLALAVFLIRGSLPAVTPEDIVKRADYEGQQPPRHIFNLYSLKQDKLLREKQSESRLQAELVPVEVPIAQTSTEESVVTTNVEPISNSRQTDAEVQLTDATTPASGSVSASTKELLKTEVPAAGVRSYEKAELHREEPLPVVSAPASKDTALLNENATASAVTVLPVYTIKAENTNLRAQPSTEASIIKSLAKGETITVFDSSGVWVQVATNDGLGTTGYVHNSLLEIADVD